MQLQWIGFAASARAVLEICVGNWFIYQWSRGLSHVYFNIIYWQGSLVYYCLNWVKKTKHETCEILYLFIYFLSFLKENKIK